MKNYLLILQLLIGLASYGQYNQVPNYSFEENIVCPSQVNGGGGPSPWYLPQGVLNKNAFLHICSSSPAFSVPSNTVGVQYAKTGLGYAIMDFYHSSFYDGRGYLQIQLKQPMVANKCYYAEFWVSLNNASRTACNNIALLVTDTAIRTSTNSSSPNFGYDLIPANPQVYNYGNPVIKDTLNWVKVSAVFTAHGGENFVTIGNFKPDDSTQLVTVNSGSGTYGKAGYYIDDIRITPLDSMVLKADAGVDKTMAPGDSAFIGSLTNGLTNINWYNSAGTLLPTAIGLPGLYVKPTASTFYVMEQTVCGQYSRDTVYVNVGVVPLAITKYEVRSTKPEVGSTNRKAINVWETANEVNVSHFNIQRSADGINFQTIAKLTAKNTASNNYQYNDEKPLNGINYYRLEAVDKDGKVAYSKVLSIALSIRPLALSIYPNPAKGKVHLVSTVGIHEIVVTDLVGRTVLKKQFNQATQLELDIASLSQGIYLLKVLSSDGAWQTKKLVVG